MMLKRAPRFDAALIDMDGTLYDSMPLHSAAWHQLCREQGWQAPDDMFFRVEGATGAATVKMLLRSNEHREPRPDEWRPLYARKAELFRAMPEPPVMPGAREMLSALVEAGVRCVLVTGSAQGSLLGRIEADFPGVFAPGMRVTALDVERGKPWPEPFLKGMEKAGSRPERTLVVENAPLGVKAGHASGAFTVGVDTGPLPMTELLEAGADAVYESMPAFAADVNRLLYDY